MMIDYKREWIFVHIPKTAGTSITRTIMDMGIGAQRHSDECIHDADHVQHLSAEQIRSGLPGGLFDRMWVVAVLRDPVKRWVSLYNYVLSTPRDINHDFMKRFGGLEPFIQWVCSRPRTRWWLARTQQDFCVSRDGYCLVDDFLRFESLDSAWGPLLSRLGLPYADLQKHRVGPRLVDERELDSDVVEAIEGLEKWAIEEIARCGR